MQELKQFTALCKSLLETESYEDVIRVALDRLESNPDDLEALLFLAESRFLKGDITDAKTELESICLRLLPLSRAFKLLGDACYKDNPATAKDYYKRYIALDPESEDLYKIQAQLEADPADGSDDELNPGFRTLTMADLMVKQGHNDTAGEILQEILSHDPGNKQALDRMGKIKVIQELEKWRKSLPRGNT
jgi:tetratricopeptide (TPR) repeat protein